MVLFCLIKTTAKFYCCFCLQEKKKEKTREKKILKCLVTLLLLCIASSQTGVGFGEILHCARASSFPRLLDDTRRTTVGRTPLDEWPVRRRDLYLTWQTLTREKLPCPRWYSNPQYLNRLAAADLRIRPRDRWHRGFFLQRSGKKYTTVVAFRSLQQLEEQHERICVKIILMAWKF